jgi:hypothetical protein
MNTKDLIGLSTSRLKHISYSEFTELIAEYHRQRNQLDAINSREGNHQLYVQRKLTIHALDRTYDVLRHHHHYRTYVQNLYTQTSYAHR